MAYVEHISLTLSPKDLERIDQFCKYYGFKRSNLMVASTLRIIEKNEFEPLVKLSEGLFTRMAEMIKR